MQKNAWKTRALITAAALVAVAPSVWAQTTTWNGTSSSLWTDSGNWDAGVPSSGSISLFNNAGNGNPTISLSGASQSIGTILFDTSSAAAYTLGIASAGDVFNLDANGGIAINSGVGANQTIGAAITMNGLGTFVANSGTSSLILGVAGAPATITLANTSVGTFAANVSGGSLIINDVIRDPGGGSGSVALTGVSGGVIQINSLNTYTGPTLLNGGASAGVAVQFNHDYNAGDPSGPFGVGTLTPNRSNNNFLEPVGGGTRIIANPVSMVTGFTVTNAGADTTSLTLTGPIVLTSASGRVLQDNLNAGATLTLGSSGSPSTFTLSSTVGQTLSISGPGALVVNDTIQDAAPGANGIIAITSTGSGPITFNGPINSNGNITNAGTGLVTFGPINSTGNETINGASGTTVFSGAITTTGNTTISGAGTLSVTYNNTVSNGSLTVSNSNAATVVAINAARGGTGSFTVTSAALGTIVLNAQSTYSGGNNLTGPGSGAQPQIFVKTSSTLSGSTLVSGPFGTGVLSLSGAAPVVFVPVGADQIVANKIAWTNGMFAGTAPASVDPTPRNLTFTGDATLGGTGRTSTNNINGAQLIFGDPASAATMTLGNTMAFQSNAAGVTGVTVINDKVTGAGAIVAQNRQLVFLNSELSDNSGTTNATGTPTNGYGTIYVTNSTGSATGTGAVTAKVASAGTQVAGAGGTIGGTGIIGGALTISTITSTTEGGNVSPGTPTTPHATLTVGSMTMDPIGRYVFDYNASDTTTGGGVNDLISSAGGLNVAALSTAALSQFDLNLNPYAGAPSGTPQSYIIATFGTGVTGSAGAISNGTDISNLFTFSGLFNSTPTVMVVDAGSGAQSLQLTFAPVPEPGTLLLVGLGTLSLGIRPKRRRP